VKNLRFIAGLACILLFVCCQKKQVKHTPRCIYDQPEFAKMCLEAAHQEEKFADFKRHPFFNLLWENLTAEEGQRWLEKVPDALLEKLRECDGVGSPQVYEYEGGVFSPWTLRLAAIAGDIQSKVGDLSGLHVVQIGAGYGGLCGILHHCANLGSYTLVDLPEQLALAQKYLERLDVKNVTYLTPDELTQKQTFDLVISDMSFSEFNRSYQELFFKKILSNVQSGFLLGHFFPKHFGVVAMTADELKERFGNVEIQGEDYLIYWKRN
jgi:hypothetical protein